MWPDASPVAAAAEAPAGDLLAGIDLDRAVTLAADPRPWHERTAWHAHAACAGDDAAVYFESDRLGREQLARCLACSVRTECAVDGIRQNFDGTVAESPDELHGFYGGLSPEQRWSLVAAVRARAAASGTRLYDDATAIGPKVVKYVTEGRKVAWIAAELLRDVEWVVDVIVRELADRGWSNRAIASLLPNRSYKWVERRRRTLGCMPCSGTGVEAAA